MKLIFIFVISIFLTQPSFAKWGKGQLKLTPDIMEHVMMYMYGAGNPKYSGDDKKKNDPDIIAISEDGKHSQYFYCPSEYRASGGCLQTGIARQAILMCEKNSLGSPCFIFAKKRRIVWKNGGKKVKIKKKDLKSPYLVAKKIQEAGFYDGDISKLTGIDVSTGQANDEVSVTGEKKKKEVSTKVDDTDIVKELENLTKLFESGALTKEEFQKAKNKLFKN